MEDYEDACQLSSCPQAPTACCFVSFCASQVIAPNGMFLVESCGALYYTPAGELVEECSDTGSDSGEGAPPGEGLAPLAEVVVPGPEPEQL